MVFFNGTLKLQIIEAINLRPTDFATRHSIGANYSLDPYISLDIDDTHFAKTSTKLKTQKPHWGEDFSTEVHNGQNLNLTVFHDAAIPPDEFIANCIIELQELVKKQRADIWVSSCEQILILNGTTCCICEISSYVGYQRLSCSIGQFYENVSSLLKVHFSN